MERTPIRCGGAQYNNVESVINRIIIRFLACVTQNSEYYCYYLNCPLTMVEGTQSIQRNGFEYARHMLCHCNHMEIDIELRVCLPNNQSPN